MEGSDEDDRRQGTGAAPSAAGEALGPPPGTKSAPVAEDGAEEDAAPTRRPDRTRTTAPRTGGAPDSSSLRGMLPPIAARLERGEKVPVCVIVVGMAGSGKTTLLSKLQESLEAQPPSTSHEGNSGPEPSRRARSPPPADGEKNDDELAAASGGGGDGDNDGSNDDESDDESDGDDDLEDDKCYTLNLDPATIHLPFECNIDIRDTINYRQVMERHQLGPNGAILTCLNLFATKFDQVLRILERRAYGVELDNDDDNTETNDESSSPLPPSSSPRRHLEYVLVDTPGQIEAFTWSASGSIVCQSLASSFPTVLCFVVDTARCASSPNTFMSNMLYACSLLYRTRLPLIVCFNKSDVVSHQFCLEWMRDHEAFQSALDDASSSSASSDGAGSGYYSSLTRSLSLVLDEFYSNFAHAVGVSAVTGQGIPEFWEQVQLAAQQDFDLYLDDVKCRVEEQQARTRAVARAGAARLRRDVAES